jgi:hypothetical protein
MADGLITISHRFEKLSPPAFAVNFGSNAELTLDQGSRHEPAIQNPTQKRART